MPQNDMLKRYLDAGIAFTQMTRARAEGIVKELVKAGEIQRDQTQERVDELMDRSRKNTEQLLQLVRSEIRQQFSAMGLATQDDIRRIEARLNAGGAPRATGTAKRSTAKKSPAAKRPAKKSTATKATSTKASAKKAPAKKTAGTSKKA